MKNVVLGSVWTRNAVRLVGGLLIGVGIWKVYVTVGIVDKLTVCLVLKYVLLLIDEE